MSGPRYFSMSIVRALSTIPIALHAVSETAKISLATVGDAAFRGVSPEACDARLARWSQRLLAAARVHLECTGSEHVDSNRRYVVMSNHQSHYDIPVLYQALPELRLRMVAKSELFRIPIWSGAMRAAGFIEISRADQRQARDAIRRTEELLENQRTSVWIAPEGTRSRTGRVAAFKRGGFHLALSAGAPILPVAITGTERVLRAGALCVERGETVRVAVLPPVEPGDFGVRRIRELVRFVKDAIEAGVRVA